jgi:hypothetical protein
MPQPVALKRVAADESALYQRYDSRPRSLATVRNRNAQAATFFRNLNLGLFSPGVFDHVKASDRDSLVVSLLFTTFTNLPFNTI